MQKGSKKKTAVIHGAAAAAEHRSSVFGSLFRGSLSSTISCAGKPGSATLQTFTAVSIELDVHAQRDSVLQGLKRFVAPEHIAEYQSGARRVPAQKQVKFYEPPPVCTHQTFVHVAAQMHCCRHLRTSLVDCEVVLQAMLHTCSPDLDHRQ